MPRSGSYHVEVGVPDPGYDVEVATEADDVGAQRVEPDGVAVLDLADPGLGQPGRLSQLDLGQPELLADLGQLGAADGGERLHHRSISQPYIGWKSTA